MHVVPPLSFLPVQRKQCFIPTHQFLTYSVGKYANSLNLLAFYIKKANQPFSQSKRMKISLTRLRPSDYFMYHQV
jgi:hypothetical protein